jgi:hypothetical protein
VATEATTMIAEGMTHAHNTDWAIRVFPGAGHYITNTWGTFAPGSLESMAVWILDHTSGQSTSPAEKPQTLADDATVCMRILIECAHPVAVVASGWDNQPL